MWLRMGIEENLRSHHCATPNQNSLLCCLHQPTAYAALLTVTAGIYPWVVDEMLLYPGGLLVSITRYCRARVSTGAKQSSRYTQSEHARGLVR
jgi:hypothetical protein